MAANVSPIEGADIVFYALDNAGDSESKPESPTPKEDEEEGAENEEGGSLDEEQVNSYQPESAAVSWGSVRVCMCRHSCPSQEQAGSELGDLSFDEDTGSGAEDGGKYSCICTSCLLSMFLENIIMLLWGVMFCILYSI